MSDLFYILEKELIAVEIVDMLKSLTEEEIDDYAIENNVCPKCYGELKEKEWYECRGEHFGFPTRERMTELVCDDCGKVY